MCEALGTGLLRLDRKKRKLYGVVSCGCGERSVPIAEAADGRLTLAIDYQAQPDLRPHEQGSTAAAAG